MLETYALALMMSFPSSHLDSETYEEREARLKPAAAAIGYAARNKFEVRALVTLGKFETEFASYVGNGCIVIPEKASGNCDGGLARSFWQVHKWCKIAWALPRGSVEATKQFAICAIQHFRGGLRRCHRSLRGAFSSYYKIGCDHNWSMKRGPVARARFMRGLPVVIRKAAPKAAAE